MSDSRHKRLEADYREMLQIQNRPYLSWVAVKGELPYVEEYLLTVKLRTYALTATDGRYIVGTLDRCTVKVALWDSYPDTAPNIRMLSIPPVFHPYWYSKGTYCPAQPWRPQDSLKDHILRMVAELQYATDMTEATAPANYKALNWYKKHEGDPALFPSDNTELIINTQEQTAAIEQTPIFSEEIDSWKIGSEN